MFTDRWDDHSATVVLPVDERTSPELIDHEREDRLISCARILLGGPAADPDSALLVLFRVVAESAIAADSTYMATVKLDRVWVMRDAISTIYDLQEANAC